MKKEILYWHTPNYTPYERGVKHNLRFAKNSKGRWKNDSSYDDSHDVWLMSEEEREKNYNESLDWLLNYFRISPHREDENKEVPAINNQGFHSGMNAATPLQGVIF